MFALIIYFTLSSTHEKYSFNTEAVSTLVQSENNYYGLSKTDDILVELSFFDRVLLISNIINHKNNQDFEVTVGHFVRCLHPALAALR